MVERWIVWPLKVSEPPGAKLIILVAHNVRVVETQRTGIVSEREHCGNDGRAEYREFVCWNYVYFHRVFGLLQYQKATRVPTGEPLLNKCSNSLFTNELTW